MTDFPSGVEFRGIKKTCRPLVGCTRCDNPNSEYLCLRYNGASAAQAAGFPVIDNFFNVDQSKDEFLNHMSLYIPFEHRQFIYWMRHERFNMIQCIELLERQRDMNHADISDIRELGDKCLSKLRKFRTTHMKIVRDMIVTPASKLQEKTKGTGGSTMIPYLETVRDRVQNKMFSKL